MVERLLHTTSLPFYTEGPVTDSNGAVYCTTLSGGTILKFDAEGNGRIWARMACPNGQYILPNGDHLVCDSKQALIARYDREGKFIRNEIEGKCRNATVHVPNDLVADAAGGIYFTDSIRTQGKVCYTAPDGYQQVIAEGLDYPNGLVLSQDQKKLFVAESYKNRILVIQLKTGGEAEGKLDLFADLPAHPSGRPESNLPDGMTWDGKGRLWVAHYGMQAVQVLSGSGEWIGSVGTPFPLVSNVFFSTANPGQLMVTGGYGEPGPGALLKFQIDG